MLLAAAHCDYRACVGTPFLVKLNANHVMMYLFEKYEDAVRARRDAEINYRGFSDIRI